jgi:hypothetical protein
MIKKYKNIVRTYDPNSPIWIEQEQALVWFD